jgi:hypothetical protein
MKARVFQPFQKIWTPRTPDSNYDSLGGPPPPPVVGPPTLTESIGTGVSFQLGIYEALHAARASAEATGVGVTLHSGSYTKAP